MAAAAIETRRWSERRRRAAELESRWPFAGEVLAFYRELVDVQEAAFDVALEHLPDGTRVAAFAAQHVARQVVEVSVMHGPAALTGMVLPLFDQTSVESLVRRWLEDDELTSAERFLARAAAGPVLEALAVAGVPATSQAGDDRHCPACGGKPQLSFLASSPEDLVTAHRFLECSRCATSWAFARMTCAACGESEGAKLVVYGEAGTTEAELTGTLVKPGTAPARQTESSARFPHLRIDACRTCSHYLLTVDVSRDGRALPLVDELAALPLNLCAKELGMTKIVPNLMGF